MTVFTADIDYKGTVTHWPAQPAPPGFDIRALANGVDIRYGTSTDAASQGVANENPTYTATIFADGVQVAQKTIPAHWYYARWRYQHTPAQIKNTAQQLMDGGLLPPWGVLVPGKGAKDPNWTYGGPMVIAPVHQPMGDVAERPDIGTVNEGSGFWMGGGSEKSMLAYAEALNTIPIYRIDERTGRFWDLLLHPKASVYKGNQQAPTSSPDYINPGPVWVQGEPVVPGWEGAHHPEAGAAAFLSTEDPYHLETLQATATQIIYWSNFHYYGAETYATIGEGQTRGMAHPLRTLALVLICTKYYEDKFGPVPKPLNSYAYWKQIADNQLDHLTKVWMNSPVTQTFRAFPNVAAFAPWQQDHLLNGLSLLAWKNPEWRALYVWAFGNLYNRCVQLPGYPGPYQLRLGPNFVDGQILDPAKLTVSQFYPDWPSMISVNLHLAADNPNGFYNMKQSEAQALLIDPTNGGDWCRANFFDMFIARNALTLGVWLDRQGIVDLHTPYPQLEAVFAQQDAYAKKVWGTDVNQFQPARQSALAPTGGIIMPNAVTINLGQKVHLDVTFVGGSQPTNPPTYTQTDATVGSLSQADMKGVLFTSLKAGVSTVTATATGANGPTSDSCVVTVNSPLFATLTLTPGTVS